MKSPIFDAIKDTQKVIAELKEHTEPYLVTALGKELLVLPGVFYYWDSVWFAENIQIKQDSTVLVIGSGTGIDAIAAAEKAKKVVATDINPAAVENTLLNVNKYNLQEVIDVRKGDVYRAIEHFEINSFDHILFNQPLNHFAQPETDLEKAVFDYRGSILRDVLIQAGDFLNPGGDVQITSTDFMSNRDDFYHVTRALHQKTKIIAEKRTEDDKLFRIWKVYSD